MKNIKKLSLILCLFGFTQMYAQVLDDNQNVQSGNEKYLKTKSADERPQGWYISGFNNIIFNQASFTNWIPGGVNSYALNANVDYEFNYTGGKHIWDNRVMLSYGVLKNDNDQVRKSVDIIDLTSVYGYEFKKNYYFATALNLNTQFADGFDYSVQDPVTGDYKKISSFMAPGYLSIGLGVEYRPNKNLQVSFHPLSSRLVFVLDKEFQYKGNFGLQNDGDSFLYELGAFLGARYKANILKNVTYDQRAGLFNNYLKDFGNMVVSYQGILDMRINGAISAQASINIFYDEDQIKKTQLKQTFGVGLVYKFNNLEKLKLKPENYPTMEELQGDINKAQENVNKANQELEKAKQKLIESTPKPTETPVNTEN